MRFAGVPGGPSVPTAWRVPFSHAQASINDCYLLGPIVVHPESVGTLGERYIRVHDLQALRAQ